MADPIQNYRERAHLRARRVAIAVSALAVVPVVLEGMPMPALLAVAANVLIFYGGVYAGIAAAEPDETIKRYLER